MNPIPASEPTGVRRGDDVRRMAMNNVFMAWIFGAFWMYAVTGVAQTRLGKIIQLPPFGFGVLAAIPFAGALMQVPASLIIERYGHHRRIFVAAGLIHRSVWILIGLVPWAFSGMASWTAFLAGIFVSSAFGNVANPVWVTWMSELIPPRIRGRFFSRRTQAGQLVGLLATLGIGWLMDEAARVGLPAMKGVTSALFAVAAVAGMTDFLYFLRVPPPVARKPKPDLRLTEMLREPLADASFRRYLGFIATLTFGTGYTGQFIWLLLFDVAHMTNTQAGFLVIVIPILVTMFCARVWGRVLDRVGRKPILILCGCLVCHGGATWLFVQGPLWWIGYGGVILASMAWPGLELAGFNLLLSMGDPRSGRRHGSAYPALYSLVTALSGILSGLFGGWLAHLVGNWQSTLFGYSLTYHGVVLLSSVGIRALALVWLPGIEEPKAAGTRTALLHVGVSAMDHLRAAVSIPVRLLMRAGQWTYRLTPRRGRGA